MPKQVVLTTDNFPKELDSRGRFARWRDIYASTLVGPVDMTPTPDRPFFGKVEIARFGSIGLALIDSEIVSTSKNARQIAAAPMDSFGLAFSRGPAPMAYEQRGRELPLSIDEAAFFNFEEPLARRAGGRNGQLGITVPRRALLERVGDAMDLVAQPLNQATPALRHLRRYAEFLLGPGDVGDDAALIGHAERTLLDLMVLAIGGRRDERELAGMRGLRAARTLSILQEIQAGFTDPKFSSAQAAQKLGLSPRYVNELLHETSAGFAARLLELRLQRVRTMLADRRHDHLKISDIALAAGFGDISYFNRCFRRRFGAPPMHYRGDGD